MPELPEVESVRKYLESKILDSKILDVNIYVKKALRNADVLELSKIKNQKITKLDRIAKHLIIHFEEHYIICHLRMEGKFFIFNNESDMNNLTKRDYDILKITTDKNIILFQDKRKFATVDIFEKDISYIQNKVLKKVGPEPFDIDENELHKKINNKNSDIKKVLLNQEIISGLGNIYVDEVLFASKIHPETKAKFLDLKDCKEIIKNSRSILKEAIKHRGTTIRSYAISLEIEGGYQKFLNVHQKKGEKCPIDGNIIKKIKVGGRGTYFCDICQKLKNS